MTHTTVVTLAVIVDKSLLVVRKRGMDAFILPGGKPLDENEKMKDTLQRELREELGVPFIFARFAKSFDDIIEDGKTDTITVHLFRGFLNETPTPCSEIEELSWLPLLKPYDQKVTPSMSRQVIPYLRDQLVRSVTGRFSAST